MHCIGYTAYHTRSMTADEPVSLRQLQVLVALVDFGSFTKAAAHLGLGQSTVSGHLADLERRLGGRLLERDRSGVRPTPVGEAILRPARETLRAEQHVREAAADVSGLLAGRLVVGGSTIPAVYLIPEHVGQFRRQHPDVSLQLRTGDSREIVDWVVSGHVDVGIVGRQPAARGLWSAALQEDELVFVCSPDHPLAAVNHVSLTNALAEPIVMREPGSGTHAATMAAFGAIDRAQSLDVVLEVGSTEAAKAAVRAGLGLSVVSRLAVREEIASGSLCRVSVDGFDVKRSFWLVARVEARLTPAARAFRDMVRDADTGE